MAILYHTQHRLHQKARAEKKHQGAVGAACNLEIERGIRSTTITTRGVHLKRNKVIPQVILTSNYNCLHNDIDWNFLQRIIRGEKAGV